MIHVEKEPINYLHKHCALVFVHYLLLWFIANKCTIYFNVTGKCFSDPDTCKDKGMTVMTSIKLDSTTLSSNSSSYIMSTGGQTTKARGFALVHIKNQYVLILGTKTKQWILKTPSLPADWFNLAFTWENGGQLKLFVDGKVVASSKALPLMRLQDMFTSFTIGRPNNSHTLKYKLGLEVDDLALWQKALTDQQILDVIKSGTIMFSFCF